MNGNALFLRNFKGKVGKIRRGAPSRSAVLFRALCLLSFCHCEPFLTVIASESAAIPTGHQIASALTCLAMTGKEG